jgi:hypothetical protein
MSPKEPQIGYVWPTPVEEQFAESRRLLAPRPEQSSSREQNQTYSIVDNPLNRDENPQSAGHCEGCNEEKCISSCENRIDNRLETAGTGAEVLKEELN